MYNAIVLIRTVIVYDGPGEKARRTIKATSVSITVALVQQPPPLAQEIRSFISVFLTPPLYLPLPVVCNYSVAFLLNLDICFQNKLFLFIFAEFDLDV